MCWQYNDHQKTHSWSFFRKHLRTCIKVKGEVTFVRTAPRIVNRSVRKSSPQNGLRKPREIEDVQLYSFFNVFAIRSWVFNATPRSLYPRERLGIYCIGGWVGPRTGLDGCGKSRSHRDLIPGPSGQQQVATPPHTVTLVGVNNKRSILLPGLESRFLRRLFRGLVTTPTELFYPCCA